jgi:hypothetical protein
VAGRHLDPAVGDEVRHRDADTTRERMKNPPAGFKLVGELEIRGRVEPVPVWTVVTPEDG